MHRIPPRRRPPRRNSSARGRVKFITPATYTQDSRTFKIVAAIIDKIKAEDDLAKLASKNIR